MGAMVAVNALVAHQDAEGSITLAHEVVDRLTSGWRVERDPDGEGASVTFSRRLR